MSLPAAAPHANRPVVISALVVVALAFALTGSTRGVAALLGAALAVGNWFALRFLAARFVHASGAGSTGFSLLLIGKIGLLMAIVYLLIARLGADPIGLALGLSVLFVGPVLVGVLGASVEARAGARERNDVEARAGARERNDVASAHARNEAVHAATVHARAGAQHHEER